MSGKLMGQIYKLKLSPSKRDILLAMAENACDDGSDCRPGVPYIAWKIGLSERQVQRIQKSLVEDRLLVIVDTPVHKPVVYQIDLSVGEPKVPFASRNKRKGDIMSQGKGDIMSPSEGDISSDLRVTSHGKQESAKGDIDTGKTVSIPLKEEPVKERDMRAHERESTPIPFHMRNGLGGSEQPNAPLVSAIEQHPVFQAYQRGWDGLPVKVNPHSASATFQAVQALQAEIDKGLYSYEDIEALTRFKLSKRRDTPYQLTYVTDDIYTFVANKRTVQAAKQYSTHEDRGHLDYIMAHVH